MIRAQYFVSHVRPIALTALLLGAACSDDDSNSDPAIDAAPGVDSTVGAIDASNNTPDAANNTPDGGSFGIVSSAYMEGGVIPDQHSCKGGINISPALMWSNAPDNTQSFAVVFLDTSGNTFLHSVIWDIPSSVTELAENIEKAYEPSNVAGAKQPNSYLGTRGYAGPCPLPVGTTHTYEFRLHALNVATLPGLSLNTSREAVVAAIEAASINSTALTASFTR